MLKITALSLSILFSTSAFSQIENNPSSIFDNIAHTDIQNVQNTPPDLKPEFNSPLAPSPLDIPSEPKDDESNNTPLTPPDLKKNSPFEQDPSQNPKSDKKTVPNNSELFNSLFSNTKVSLDSQVTQIRLLNSDSLKKSGINNNDIFSFINKYSTFTENFFFKFPPSDGKIIFAVSVKPFLQGGLSKAADLGVSINSRNELINFCHKNLTYCSITSVQSIANQNFKKNVLNSFEQALYQKDYEIFWHNFDYTGEVNFYFEISLKSS